MALDTKVAVLPVAWRCAALHANHGDRDPPECDWPNCGCDPHFERVVVGLREAGWIVDPPQNARQAKHDPDCYVCHGTGEYFGHADDCEDDLCALNGDQYSCVGQVIECGCQSPQERIVTAVQTVMARLADLLDEDHFNNIDSIMRDAGIPYPTPAQTKGEQL